MNTIDSELIQTLTVTGDLLPMQSGIHITADIDGAYNQIYELNEKIYELSKSMETIGVATEKLKESFDELSERLKKLEGFTGADTEKPKGDLDIFDLNFDEILAYPIGWYI